MLESVRLAKRLAHQLGCSRQQAEQYIEGGWVRVDGKVIESPQHRVQDEKIEFDNQARLAPLVPMTLLLHKPVGFDWADGRQPAGYLLTQANRSAADRSGIRLLQRHFKAQECTTPLEAGASGLLVFTQDFSIKRKLWSDAALVENEIIVEATGEVTEATLRALNRPHTINDEPFLSAKVAISSQTDGLTGLRFALKGAAPGRIATVCERLGLRVVAMRRIRVGRVPMAGLEPGKWRYLMPHERF